MSNNEPLFRVGYKHKPFNQYDKRIYQNQYLAMKRLYDLKRHEPDINWELFTYLPTGVVEC